MSSECVAMLEYFDDDRQSRKKGSIDLSRCVEVLQKLGSSHYQNVFCLRTKHHGHDRTYFLAADTEEEMTTWVSTLCRVLHLDDGSKVLDTSAAARKPTEVTKLSEVTKTSEATLPMQATKPSVATMPPETTNLSVAETGFVPRIPSDKSDSSSIAASTQLHVSPMPSPNLSISMEQENPDDGYILLDECFSGSSSVSPMLSSSSPGNTLSVRNAAPAEYLNVDSLGNSKLAEDLMPRDWSLGSSVDAASPNAFLDNMKYAAQRESEDATDLGIWDCHSVADSAYSSNAELAPALPAKMGVGSSLDDAPATAAHRTPSPMYGIGTPSAPAPHPQMAVPGRMHRYINTAPTVVRSQTPLQKNYSETSTSVHGPSSLRPLQQSTASSSPLLPPKAHGSSRSSPVPDRRPPPSPESEDHAPYSPPVCTERTISFKTTDMMRRNGNPVLLPVRKTALSESSSSNDESEDDLADTSTRNKGSRTDVIQYADLDLMDTPSADVGRSEKSPVAGRSDSTEYHEIDMVKTQALASTRKEVETGRRSSERSLDI